MGSFGAREIKKAKTKLACLDATLELTRNCAFRDLKSKEIASHAGISEMTFFNYFSTKEDLLVYFMRLWSLEEMARNMTEPLTGREAIDRIFSATAEKIKQQPTIMMSLIGFFASLTSLPKMAVVEPAERWLLYPELEDLQTRPIPGLHETLMQHLEEMDGSLDRQQLRNHLITLFYGGALNAHMSWQDLTLIYQDGLELIFKKAAI